MAPHPPTPPPLRTCRACHPNVELCPWPADAAGAGRLHARACTAKAATRAQLHSQKSRRLRRCTAARQPCRARQRASWENETAGAPRVADQPVWRRSRRHCVAAWHCVSYLRGRRIPAPADPPLCWCRWRRQSQPARWQPVALSEAVCNLATLPCFSLPGSDVTLCDECGFNRVVVVLENSSLLWSRAHCKCKVLAARLGADADPRLQHEPARHRGRR